METKRAKPGFELTQMVLKTWVVNIEIVFLLDQFEKFEKLLHLKNLKMKTNSSLFLKNILIKSFSMGVVRGQQNSS